LLAHGTFERRAVHLRQFRFIADDVTGIGFHDSSVREPRDAILTLER
jgi:hypothetical protein